MVCDNSNPTCFRTIPETPLSPTDSRRSVQDGHRQQKAATTREAVPGTVACRAVETRVGCRAARQVGGARPDSVSLGCLQSTIARQLWTLWGTCTCWPRILSGFFAVCSVLLVSLPITYSLTFCIHSTCWHCRNIAGPGGKRTPSGSREASRESSRNRQQSRERPVEPSPPAATAELTEAEMEKKTKAIMEEYLHIQDTKVRS